MSRIVSLEVLNEGLDFIRQSPLNNGIVHLIVRRPEVDFREELETAQISIENGLEGDNWNIKPSSSMPNGTPHPEKQITLMNSRSIALIAQNLDRWKLAGDQFFVDMNLGYGNLPPGTHLQLGTAIIEITEPPHRGCKKFATRFGEDAMRFVNSEAGRELNLRGVNAKVLKGGVISLKDHAIKFE